MNHFYRTGGPTAPPSPPSRWSYSTLKEWRRCPRQWWLKRADYVGLSERYPQPIHPTAIEGRLIHDALEAFANHAATESAEGTALEEIRRAFAVRSYMKRRLREILSEDVEPNPRVEKTDLLARISIDSCVDGFRRGVKALGSMPFQSREPRVKSDSVIADPSPYDGPERTITIDDPPITGRFDWSRYGVICDFKTGDPDPTHAEQLRLYAVLVWAAFGVQPGGLEIHYVRTDERVRVEVPSVSELSALQEELRREITSANETIRAGSAPPNPSEEHCRWCPVRQFCDAFWNDSVTSSLRWPRPEEEVDDGAAPEVLFADVRLTDFRSETSGDGYHGFASAGGKTPAVSIPAAWTPGAGIRPGTLQLLGARVESQSDQTVVSVARHTEVFWSS